jgi:predicted nucleic-acid-binding Zn-ribbon protein
MRAPVKNAHRIMDCEEHAGFMLDDGIDVISKSAITQTCHNCNHSELPNEGKEAVDPSTNEGHKNPQFPLFLHNWFRDLL